MQQISWIHVKYVNSKVKIKADDEVHEHLLEINVINLLSPSGNFTYHKVQH
jgi:hypothetical protein